VSPLALTHELVVTRSVPLSSRLVPATMSGSQQTRKAIARGRVCVCACVCECVCVASVEPCSFECTEVDIGSGGGGVVMVVVVVDVCVRARMCVCVRVRTSERTHDMTALMSSDLCVLTPKT
jgi:hypothetical protein